jgi:cob(I)alamin adenosyltransferase
MRQGLIQAYTGDGKGKTTAALGQVVRAHGRGLRAAIFQLLKMPGGSGEHRSLAGLSPTVPIYAMGSGDFILGRQPTEAEVRQAEECWKLIKAAIRTKTYDIIVIDEISHALNKGLLKMEEVLEVLKNKPAELELILTGRDMPPAITNLADLVTEMKMVKHPFQQGIEAREGIEF